MKSDSSALYFGSSEKFLSCCDFTIYNSCFRKQIKQRYTKQQKQRNKFSVWCFLLNVDRKKVKNLKNVTEFVYFDMGSFTEKEPQNVRIKDCIKS